MAYLGSTASSSLVNPPRAVQPINSARIDSTAGPLNARLWLYASTGDSTDPFTANYFSDAQNLGMKEGDIVMYVGRTSTVTSSQVLGMGVVGAVSTDGTQLSTWSLITST